MLRITIVVVGSPWFSRIVGHLLGGQSEFEIVGEIRSLRSLGRQARQPLPQLIVADVKPVRTGIRRAVAARKLASPSSKVILTCPVEHLARAARGYGADACLSDERLAGGLLRLARTVSGRPAAAEEPY